MGLAPRVDIATITGDADRAITLSGAEGPPVEN
jgi:hypothetical protein